MQIRKQRFTFATSNNKNAQNMARAKKYQHRPELTHQPINVAERVEILIAQNGSAEKALDFIGKFYGDVYGLKIALGYDADFCDAVNADFDAVWDALVARLPRIEFANEQPREFNETSTDCTSAPDDFTAGGYVVNVCTQDDAQVELANLAQTDGRNAATVQICSTSLMIEITKYKTEYGVRYLAKGKEVKLRRAFAIPTFEANALNLIAY